MIAGSKGALSSILPQLCVNSNKKYGGF